MFATNCTYLWDDGQEGNMATNLSIGKHCVSISEEGKPECVTELCYDIKDRSATLAASINIASVTNANSCSINKDVSGALSLSSKGGSIDLECGIPNCTYQWSSNTSTFSATTQDISDLQAGEYTVVVTESGGCKSTLKVKICCCNDISGIKNAGTGGYSYYSYSCKSDAFSTGNGQTLDFTLSSNIVYGTTKPLKGSIYLTTSGGTGIFYYQWTKIGGGTLPSNYTNKLENLDMGKYQVVVTDGCNKKTLDFELKNCDADPLEIIGNIRNNCETFKYGKIDITMNHGSGNYDITWNTGEKTTTIEKLYAKIYTVKVIDKTTGCTAEEDFEVRDNVPIEECLCREKEEIFSRMNLFSSNSCSVSGGKSAIKFSFNSVAIGSVTLPDLNVKFKIFWPNGTTSNGFAQTGGIVAIGQITNGLTSYPISTAGSYTVKLQIDECVPRTYCFPFGDGTSSTFCGSETVYSDFEGYPIPAFFLLNTIRTRLVTCNICGAACPKEPGVINGLGGNGDCKESKLTYAPIDKFNPCSGGNLSTDCGILNFQTGINGIEVLKLDTKKAVGDGFCEYECGCIYPEGSVTNSKQFAGTQFWVKTKKVVADPTCTLPPPPPPPSNDKNCDGQIFTKPNPLYPDCFYDEYCLSKDGIGIAIKFKVPVGFSCIYNPEKASEGKEECYAVEYCVKTDEVLSYIKSEKVPCLNTSNCNTVSKGDDPLVIGLKSCVCDAAKIGHDNGDTTIDEDITYEKKQAKGKSTIYPNPFTGKVIFSADAPEKSNIKLRIFNALGSVIYQQDYDLSKGKNEITLGLDKIPDGFYLLQITDGNNLTWTERLIKQ